MRSSKLTELTENTVMQRLISATSRPSSRVVRAVKRLGEIEPSSPVGLVVAHVAGNYAVVVTRGCFEALKERAVEGLSGSGALIISARAGSNLWPTSRDIPSQESER